MLPQNEFHPIGTVDDNRGKGDIVQCMLSLARAHNKLQSIKMEATTVRQLIIATCLVLTIGPRHLNAFWLTDGSLFQQPAATILTDERLIAPLSQASQPVAALKTPAARFVPEPADSKTAAIANQETTSPAIFNSGETNSWLQVQVVDSGKGQAGEQKQVSCTTSLFGGQSPFWLWLVQTVRIAVFRPFPLLVQSNTLQLIRAERAIRDLRRPKTKLALVKCMDPGQANTTMILIRPRQNSSSVVDK